MKAYRNMSVIIFLTPFIILCSLSLLNIDQKTKIKFLTWTTPNLSIGLLTLISGGSGFILGSSLSMLIQASSLKLNRKIKYTRNEKINSDEEIYENENINETDSDKKFAKIDHESFSLGRDINDPSPTIEVPYKVFSKSKESTSFTGKLTNNYNEYLEQEEEVEEVYSNYEENDNIRVEKQVKLANEDWEDNATDEW